MPKLNHNTVSAERNAGCIFSETFENSRLVTENGGTIVGSPDINFGADLDGSNDYIAFSGVRMGESASIRIRFKPNFASNDGVVRTFWDTTTNSGNYRMMKNADNTLRIENVNTAISALAYNVWSPHWNEFGINEFIVTYPTTSIYLNGVLIGTGSKTGTNFDPSLFYVGVLNSGVSKFAGEIKSFQVFNKLLTAKDAENYYNNSQFNFRNKAVLDLPMGMEQHDPSGDGGTVGNELLTDGDMEAVGVGDWTVVNDAVLTKETATRTGGSGTQVLRVARDGTNSPIARQTILNTGQTYRITGWGRGDGSAIPWITTGATDQWTGTSSTDWQYFDIVIAADTTFFQLKTLSSTGTQYTEWDDVSIKLSPPKTLDVSGSGAPATFGDGETTTTYPTKTDKHGYDFDGGDYLTGTATGLFNSDQISIVCEFYPDFATDEDLVRYLYDASSGNRYLCAKRASADSNVLRILLGNITVANIPEATYSPFWYKNQKNVLVINGDATNNLVNVWLNGNQILTNGAVTWSNTNPDNYYLGSWYGASSAYYDGKITGFQVYPFLLSAVQREQILLDSKHNINNV